MIAKETKNEATVHVRRWNADKVFVDPDLKAITILRSDSGKTSFEYILKRLGLPANTSIVTISVKDVSYCQRKVPKDTQVAEEADALYHQYRLSCVRP